MGPALLLFRPFFHILARRTSRIANNRRVNKIFIKYYRGRQDPQPVYMLLFA